MGTGTIVGYVVLFVFLLLLIVAHPGFILLLLFVIIIMLSRNIKKRKKQKTSIGRTYPRDYPKSVDSDDEYRKKRDASRAKMGFSTLKEESKKDKSTLPFENQRNYARIIPGDEQIDDKDNEIDSHDTLKQNTRLDAIQNSFEKNYKEIIGKKSFNRYYWTFRYDEHIENKKRKFFEAIEFCETNNLGSKAKIRRLRMKMDRWNVENERDMEAIMPEYDYLLSLIEEFETR